jgi:hypothetical protein
MLIVYFTARENATFPLEKFLMWYRHRRFTFALQLDIKILHDVYVNLKYFINPKNNGMIWAEL